MLIYETEEKKIQFFYEILVCFFCHSPWYYDIIYLWLYLLYCMDFVSTIGFYCVYFHFIWW